MIKFRKLEPNDMEIKIGNVTKYGYILLLYKNARVDMSLLDETVGAENWQSKFYEVCGNLYCSVGIKCDNEWVWKDDCGVESAFGDKEKGQASDARKRAGFAWGIGRELYTVPVIRINCDTIYDEKSKSYKIKDDDEKKRKFSVQEISYDDKGNIKDLTIIDNKGIVAYSTNNKIVSKLKIEEDKTQTNEHKYICCMCGKEIDSIVANYSKNKYGTQLCRNCQKLQGGQN